MTTTSFCGSDWGKFANHGAYSGWGDIDKSDKGLEPDYDATSEMLGDMVIAEFNRLAYEAGSTMSWYPGASEVYHDIDESDSLLEMADDFREQAQESIMSKWCNCEIEAIYQAES